VSVHSHQLHGRRWLVAVLLAPALAAACGTKTTSKPVSTTVASNVGCASGTVSGAGSTFVQTIVQQWIKDFGSRCPDATVNYQGIGSGAGIQQFTAGTVDFAASDVPMKPDEQAAAEARVGPVLHIPWSAGGVALEYHLRGVSDLKLTPQAVAGIFTGQVNKWDDPAITSTNAGVRLPSTSIQVVHRSDGSGTTAAFTAYLSAVAPSVWTLGSAKDVPWPTGQGAKGSDGVTAAVKQAEGSIGYAEVSFAKGASLGIAEIENASGSFIGPDAQAVSSALADAEIPSNLEIKLNYEPTSASAYPVSTVTYVIVPRAPADRTKAKLIKAFVLYALGDGQASASALYYASLPKPLAAQAKVAAQSIGS